MRARDNGGTPTRDDVQRLRAEASPSTAMEAALEDAEEEENDEHDEEESAEEEENDEESDEEDEDDAHDEDGGVLSKQDDQHNGKNGRAVFCRTNGWTISASRVESSRKGVGSLWLFEKSRPASAARPRGG